jgi:hypothetical protein
MPAEAETSGWTAGPGTGSTIPNAWASDNPDTADFPGSCDLEEGEWLEVTIAAGTSGCSSLHAYDH